ncbi:MMPL family transporter [Nonomuraea sp. NPDC050404]|uniref:MMPL family transporter n=1 Tax=Nonomuraea sp. NPDC050404 TaxID=3155783 RepID=UPI0034068C43
MDSTASGGRGRAVLADSRQVVGQRLGWMLAIAALATMIVVTLMTGAPVLGVKALLLNALSMGAAFGFLVYVFQDGNLKALVGDFTATGTLDTIMPILVFGVAFGLSMDYEMFLLSRVTEEYRRHGDTRAAVTAGLRRTGGLFTSAALIFAVVMAALATSSLVLLKMMGLGVLVAVMLDATLVRALLAPAIMQLMSGANWWSPRTGAGKARRKKICGGHKPVMVSERPTTE